ncbi:hypothetical protein SSP531S_17760 [Streptomyces spongiicola]|uniref:Uncharacterized protein n=1 Tax=Streptomyces spongiicola TaxID=1690221 RepID=A0A2S1Z463_9ACTN|nr:hypothetical protein [Streptomyces spongiicola]AWK11159.1 hypothetical protein DDQ41_22060 [Streptomyces spongiicola]GBQ00361.1 hypothetical protein SSP531S_17760 [Streptomyces spongiicola]
MKKLAWATKGLAAVTGAVLAGAVMAPSAAADTMPEAMPDAMTIAHEVSGLALGDDNGKRCRIAERDVSAAVVGDSATGVPDREVKATTDRKGNAYLYDSANPGVWIPLRYVPGAPECTEDLDVTAADGDAGSATREFLITLLAGSGHIYQARCDVTPGVPLTESTIASACAPGFAHVVGTPV